MKPLVSCICVTQNRRLFLRRAVSYFVRARDVFLETTSFQAELVILDGSERAFPFTASGSLVRYVHEPSPPGKMGARRNRACELARGDIILHWDDDDWQSPMRIVKQGNLLAERYGHALAFTSEFYAYHLAERRAARWRSWGRGGSLGATLAYHRKAWEAAPFRDVDTGEDNFFWDDQIARGTAMVDMTDPSLMVYLRHNRNGSPFITEGATDADTEAARAILDDDLPFYDELSEILPLDQWNQPAGRAFSPGGFVGGRLGHPARRA
jgi:glycosyltransferase involved in cell wall biosynthesis